MKRCKKKIMDKDVEKRVENMEKQLKILQQQRDDDRDRLDTLLELGKTTEAFLALLRSHWSQFGIDPDANNSEQLVQIMVSLMEEWENHNWHPNNTLVESTKLVLPDYAKPSLGYYRRSKEYVEKLEDRRRKAQEKLSRDAAVQRATDAQRADKG